MIEMSDVNTFIVAVTALVVAVTALIPVLLTLRETKKVHKIVNQQRTDSVAYQLKLTNALRADGIDVPVDDSVTPPS
jgi:hypothetical protein